MAEKYGVVPKRFTKAWWSYFWMYYKWHTIATAFIVLCIGVTVRQCVTAPKYDLTVTYAGGYALGEETENKFTEILTEYTEDINKNGESLPYFQPLVISDNQEDAQYSYAMQTKLMLEFQNDNSFLFILDKSMADAMINGDAYSGVFAPVSDWTNRDLTDDDVIKDSDGTARAVSLKDSAVFKNAQIPCDDLYIAVKLNGKDDEENTAAFENSKKIADTLISK